MRKKLPFTFRLVALGFSFAVALSLAVSSAKANDSENLATQTQTNASTRKVEVKDAAGQPVIGAVVSIKGTNKASATDVSGQASIAVPTGGVLTIAFMGYKSVELPITAADGYVVTMEEDAISMDEVVVVGYGTQKKANLTGSVSQVNMEKVLGDRPVTSIGSALQGAIPGLVITGGSAPGTSKTFNIRGTTSINGGGPLILVDNVPADIDMINPEDVQTVTVLKDAASTAIYGARAAFGVVLITTKKAQKNTKLTLNYNNNFGFEQSLNRTSRATTKQILSSYMDTEFGGTKFVTGQDIPTWIGLLDQYENDVTTLAANGKFIGSYNDIYVLNGTNEDVGSNRYYLLDNNQQEQMLSAYGFQHTHNVSASGGSDKITYRIAMGYTSNDGTLKTSKDSYNRINVSSYVNADITKWLSTSLDIKYAKGTQNDPYLLAASGNLWNANEVPFVPRGMVPFQGEEYYSGNRENLLLNAPVKVTTNENPRIYSRTSIRPVKGLEAIFEYTYDMNSYDFKQSNVGPKFITTSLSFDNGNTVPQYWNNKSTTNYNALNAYATYQIDIKQEHNFKIMAGFTQENRNQYDLNVNRKDLINPSMPSISGATGEITAEDKSTEYIIRGGYFRFNYDYKSKYLVEINGRYDGSSKFPPETRYGFFPSASLGWQLAQESFMDWSDGWLDEFKIRASWGQVGNQAIEEYGYTAMMDSYKANWIVGGTKPISLKTPGMVRSNYTWEVVETLDIGLDLTLFNNRLSASGGWYQRDTKGMLAKGMDFPSVVGAASPKQNAADLRTQGWELSMNWRDQIGHWSYNVGFNLFDSWTEITKFANSTNLLFNAAGDKQRYQGELMGEIWGYETEGYYTIDDFKSTQGGAKGWQDNIWNLKDGVQGVKGVSLRPGDVKFKNQSDWQNSENMIDKGEGTLDNPGDQIVIGNTTARFQYGITAGVSWKGIALSLFLQGVGQRDAYTNDAIRFPWSQGSFGTIYGDQLDYWTPRDKANGDWTPVNPDAYHARIYDKLGNSGHNRQNQTKYLLDASYLRIKNVTLSYSVPRAAMQTIGMTGAKVFCSVENLHTFTNLPDGYDPERVTWGYPFYRTISFGVSLTL